MNKATLTLIALSCALSGAAQTLLPSPTRLTRGEGVFRLDGGYKTVDRTGLALHDEPMVMPWVGKPAHGTRVMLFRLWGKHSEEGYRLHVTADSVVVSADTREGFLHAVTTLGQWRKDGALAAADICDEPAFAWRGLMIDVSRHIFPTAFLKETIDNMAAVKLNRLHLHLTDAGGWRLQINRYPRLTSFGAWRTVSDWNDWQKAGTRKYLEEGTPGAYGGYYTQSEMRGLVAYAASRGITVVPEIEMPGHSDEVLAAYPRLACVEAGGKPIPTGEFCPGNEATYTFLQHVLDEVMAVFPSRDIHVGGDEAAMTAWRSCVHCRARMRAQGMTGVGQLQSYMIRRIARYLRQHGRQLVGWDEVLADSLGANAGVMVWRDAGVARDAIRRGYKVVMAPSAYCYIQSPQDNTDAGTQSGYLPLARVYGFDPLAGLTAAEARGVRGVQACVWTEYVETRQQMEQRLYPRLFAIAETGWNGRAKAPFGHFRERSARLVEQMRARGVNAFDMRHEQGDRPEARQSVEHAARGCTVIYNKPWNSQYAAQGGTTLTDGHRGGWNHADGRWQGFLGTGNVFDVTVDLAARMPVRSVSVTFMHDAETWISVPRTFTVMVSDDNHTWRTIHSDARPVPTGRGPSFHVYGWQGAGEARYVRIQASAVSTGQWIFADEIIIR